MITFQYILLHFLLLCILFVFCRKISCAKNDSNYWKLAFFPMVAYTLEEGLRWGREIDWNLYYDVYNTLASGGWTGHEPLFSLMWKLCGILQFPYPLVITLSSLLFIYSLFFFFKPYRNVIWIAIPLSVASHIVTSSNLIRWYMAISFCLISFALYRSKKNILGLLFFSGAFLTHYAMLPMCLFFLLCNRKKPISRPSIAIVVCLVLILFFDKSLLVYLGPIFRLFENVNRFTQYFDRGISGLMSQSEETKSLAMTFFSFIPYIAFIMYGNRLCKKNMIPWFYYNMVVVASYLKIISAGMELFGRYYYVIDFFVCLMAAHVVAYLKVTHKKMIGKILFAFCILFFIRKAIYMCTPFQYDEMMLYVWNTQIDPQALYYFRQGLLK